MNFSLSHHLFLVWRILKLPFKLWVDWQLLNVCNCSWANVLIRVDFKLSVFGKHYLGRLELWILVNYWANYYIVFEVVGRLFAQGTQPSRIGAGWGQNQKIVKIETLIMTAEYPPHRSLDPFNSKRTYDRYLDHLACYIFSISDLKTSVQHIFGFVKTKYVINSDFLYNSRYRPIFHQINSDQMILRLNAIVFWLLFRNSLNNRNFVLMVYQVLSQQKMLVFTIL